MKRILLVVTGPPCAGKTTLAAQLGLELSLPVVHRDVLKEILFDTLGSKRPGVVTRSRWSQLRLAV